jgi:2-dehydropantoate 2-reductase
VRIVVLGAGAIGGVIGGRLAQHGHDVVLIARGPHHDAIRDHGLVIESPDDRVTLRVPVVDSPSRIRFGPDDVVFACTKTQDTAAALDALASTAPTTTPIVCAQNGVENERLALRRFARVYAMCVMCPASHLDPGIVQASSSPVSGILDLGRYPEGVDEVAEQVADVLGCATFDSRALPDVMRWKHTKLLMNLGNAIEATIGRTERARELAERARAEGVACLAAAGIAFASAEEDTQRRGDRLRIRPIAGARRGGGSSWQSLARGARRIEVDHLNGEIVMLGRLHGVPTPVNEALQRLANAAARDGRDPGSVAESELDALLERASTPTESRDAPRAQRGRRQALR